MTIYCCQCKKEVEPNLIDGSIAYNHRPDLHFLYFWQCPHCKNFVGTHKTKQRWQEPLGCIATQAMKDARRKLHCILDPLWKNKLFTRKDLYKIISEKLGYEYHTANTKSLDEIKKVETIITALTDNNKE